MRNGVLLSLILLSFNLFSVENSVILTNEILSRPIVKNILVIEDRNHELSIKDIISGDYDPSDEISNKRYRTVDFSSSKFWLKFNLENQTAFEQFYLEAGRPITDIIALYKIHHSQVMGKIQGGDAMPYYEKKIRHRKNLFPLNIEYKQSLSIVLEIYTGGEGLTLPIMVHEPISFTEQDYKDQFKNGFYYGLVVLIIVIYFFFYLLLRDITFLYYIIYAFFQGLLQFSLDGFSHHHFFPNNTYFLNRFPLITGALAIIFMLLFIDKFLNLRAQSKPLKRTFQVCILVMSLSGFFIFSPEPILFTAFPIVNGLGFISISISVASIYYFHYKKVKVDPYFTLAFTILIAGAIVFILGNFNVIPHSEFSLNALKLSSVFEFVTLSISMSYKYKELQNEKELAQSMAIKVLDESKVKLELEVKERTFEIEAKNKKLVEANREILSSINYAKRIQEAILPSDDHVKMLLPQSYIYYQPKDVVSGDFYFVESVGIESNQKVAFAAVDCTGHGVPGAFMSIVGNNLLNQAVIEKKISDPSKILEFLNNGVKQTLKQGNQNHQIVRDGMDLALCVIDLKSLTLDFAGAKNPLYIIRSPKKIEKDLSPFFKIHEYETQALIEIKADKHPIGNYIDDVPTQFQNHHLELYEGDLIYIFSDGFADQFGGDRGKKYLYGRFRKFLVSIAHEPLDIQMQKLHDEFLEWKGTREQIDDILVIGVKV